MAAISAAVGHHHEKRNAGAGVEQHDAPSTCKNFRTRSIIN
jgi:hypothetical protein